MDQCKPLAAGSAAWLHGQGHVCRLSSPRTISLRSSPLSPTIDTPQLYFPIAASFNEKVDTPRLLDAIKQNAKTEIQIHRTEIVTREPLMYYRPNKDKYSRFIKIYCWSTAHQNALARVLESSDQSRGLEDMMKQGKLYDLTVISYPR